MLSKIIVSLYVHGWKDDTTKMAAYIVPNFIPPHKTSKC